MNKKVFKGKLHEIKSLIVKDVIPKVNVGKNGLRENILKEIDRQLDRHKTVKVKILKNATLTDEIGIKDIGGYLSEMLKARVIDIRGRTITLYRE
ncbi:MAG: YhbY family RNA-binding protein [Candidatus Methanomethylicia archaeon]|nr:YhbY family RNA-binding protein [Candidatus Methanomethylicia archaeon]MCX8169302.1 YhbY family RNA-binding protein [Candidatus Methanomethylicia archaeon]MDW7988915.1 YhbY family RNA-binding protein [Nitrososphaerota archaeon]